MRSSNGRKSGGHHSFIVQEPQTSTSTSQTISYLGNMHVPPVEIGSRINGRLSSSNLQQMSNLQENAYAHPQNNKDNHNNNRSGIKMFPNPNSNLNDGRFNARDQAIFLNSPYIQNQSKQQSLLKRQSMGANGPLASEKRSSSTVVGSALIHTQADSGSSASLVTKKPVDGKFKRSGGEEDYLTDNDQDIMLHANISAGISIDGGRRRQSQQHQFLTPNINGTRQSQQQNNQAIINQQPILKPLHQKQIITGGATALLKPTPMNDQLAQITKGSMGSQGFLLPNSSPSRKQFNSKTTIDDTQDSQLLMRNESKVNMSPGPKKGRLSDIMPAKVGRQSEYNAERIKQMKQIQKHSNELRMNATPTPQIIETDLRKIFQNETEMNVSRAATQNHNETKTTTQARQLRGQQDGGNKSASNDYTAYNFKQISLGRPLKYDGNRYPETDSATKRPDGQKTSIFRQSFDLSKNGMTNKMTNSPSQHVSLKSRLNNDESNVFSELPSQDSGSFDVGNNSPAGNNFRGFLPSYTNNRLIKQKLNNSDGDISEFDNSPIKRANIIKKPANGPHQHIERIDSMLQTVQSQSDLLSKATLTQNEPSIVESFAVKTRQGFIPSQAKPNQDSFISVKNLGGIEGLWMFGVCDGHGINGHHVSNFVKKNLPKILSGMFFQVIGSGKKTSKQKKGKAALIHKEDVILPPLVKNQKANSNFQSFHSKEPPEVQHYSGDESSNDSPELKRNNRSESAVTSIEELQEQEAREQFYQWFRNKIDQRDTHIREAFRLTNERLDTSTRIDCMMSGTTVVVTLMYKNMIICANAGDSRAVMFSSSSDGMRHLPLSRDHKPEDSDEAARIRACNGRVEQSKIMPGVQLFGINGKPVNNLAGQHYGPKRVWLKNKQVPGLAMTRSLGDFVAKSVGVTSEPEIKVFSNISESDKAIVIASDGIWDRIPNEEMAQVLQPFHEKRDPEGAAMELTRISVERWQKDHGMVDDITIVVIFMNTAGILKIGTTINTKQL